MEELRIEVPAPKKHGVKAVKMTDKRQEKLKSILDELKGEMERVDRIRKKVREEKLSFFTPQQNKKLVEEIDIPPLKLFRERPKEKS